MIEIRCPACGTTVRAVEDVLGKTISCSACKHTFIAVASSYPGGLPAGQGAVSLPAGERNSGMATASMVLGIISIPTCMLYGIPSLVCGILAVVLARSAATSVQPARLSSSSASMAKAGKICGWVGIGLSIAFWAFIIILIAVGMSMSPMTRRTF